ncbi:MAG: alpha-2-macroglobulin family protein, partial [Bacteroidota bacterium]
ICGWVILPAQDLLTSRQKSQRGYIYQLTDKEAKKIYKKGSWIIDSSFYHTLVASYLLDSGFQQKLSIGHYLKTYAYGNEQHIFIQSVSDIMLYVLNNSRDLLIQLRGKEGNLITEAKIKVNGKRLRFDPDLQAYRKEKSNQQGVIEISYQGNISFASLDRRINNPVVGRAYSQVMRKAPVKYLWLPIEYVLLLPVDGVKSITHRYPQGKIARTVGFARRTFKGFMCLFDEYHCRNRYTRWPGYLVTNKPRYLPNDTVKVKAFIVNENGKPLKKSLLLKVGPKTLFSVSPTRPGSYQAEFVLHDSLNLKLDDNIGIKLLEEKRSKEAYISRDVKYEDYELDEVKLSLAISSRNHYRDSSLTVSLKAVDSNGLLQKGGTVELLVKSVGVHKAFKESVFIPDTLLYLQKPLFDDKPFSVEVPDSLFPEVNLKYEISASLLTTTNQRLTKKEKVQFFHKKEAISLTLLSDSLSVSFRENTQERSVSVSLYGHDIFGNKELIAKDSTPYILPVNPHFYGYEAVGEAVSEELTISQEAALLQFSSTRTKDSLFITSVNPRNIPFSYFLYRKNQEIEKGYAQELMFSTASTLKQDYFLSIQYIWGGTVIKENFQIPFYENELRIQAMHPLVVHPGQEVDIEVSVTDVHGEAVEGVDLTVYGYTSKFDKPTPALPYLGKLYPSRKFFNEFSASNESISRENPLVNTQWIEFPSLDSIPYYQFIYPGDSVYRFRYPVESGITQFAPFVYHKGNRQNIHIIYLDNSPVYVSWSENTSPYSFRVDSGYHTVRLRTARHEILIDSLFFEKGHKHIFSVSPEHRGKHIRVSAKEPVLSAYEKAQLYPYTFPYTHPGPDVYRYLYQGEEVHFLLPDPEKVRYPSETRVNLAGPVSGRYMLKEMDGFSTAFRHEGGYKYEFSPDLLKMTSLDEGRYFPESLWNYGSPSSLVDEVYTSDSIEEFWKLHIAEKRRRKLLTQPPAGEGGTAALRIDLSKVEREDQLLNSVLLRQYAPILQAIYPGTSRKFSGLAADVYRLMLLFPGEKYVLIDSIVLSPNGLTILSIPDQPMLVDSFGQEINRILEAAQREGRLDKADDMRLHNLYQHSYFSTVGGNMIKGRVVDAQTNAPLNGVAVTVKGTRQGTFTNEEGEYSFFVPPNRTQLSISYLGYAPRLVTIDADTFLLIRLKQEALMLEEVVVREYDVVSKKRRRYAGVTTTLAGRAKGVRIKGLTSVKMENPLIIINGQVYTGDASTLQASLIANAQVLSGEEAVSLYGARAANGVMLINTDDANILSGMRKNNFLPEVPLYLSESGENAYSIRQNFSDYAFWEPNVTTDQEGKASVSVQYPDDITGWDIHVLALNGEKQSGQLSQQVKSYKPVMAKLSVPRFLLEGDTVRLIGEVSNYTSDTVQVSTYFSSDERREKYTLTDKPILDYSYIIAGKDSQMITYQLETP